MLAHFKLITISLQKAGRILSLGKMNQFISKNKTHAYTMVMTTYVTMLKMLKTHKKDNKHWKLIPKNIICI